MNPVIVVAILIQAVISAASKVAGAIAGYLITTGILLWGLSLYGGGDQIALAGIPLPPPVFFVVVLIWYGFDTAGLMAAVSAPASQNAQPPRNEKAGQPLDKTPTVVSLPLQAADRQPWEENTNGPLGERIASAAALKSPTIAIICPSCQKRLKAPANVAGRRVRCPACGIAFAATRTGPNRVASPALPPHGCKVRLQ